MAIYIILAILCFAASWAGTLMVRALAIHKRLIDLPNERSSHQRVTPLGGGIAISLAWYAGLSVLAYLGEVPFDLFFALLPGVVLLLVGVVDDKVGLSPYVRLVAQVSVVALGLWLLGGINNEIAETIGLPNWLIQAGALVLGVWFINLYNFYDGIDGNLGSEVIMICVAITILVGVSPLVVLAASTLGFLLWNWQKARIFMGDAGSTLLGLTLYLFCIYFQSDLAAEKVNPVVWIMASGVALFDTTITLIRRIIYKENVLLPHKNQMFHRLVASGMSHRKAVLTQQSMKLAIIPLCYWAHTSDTQTVAVAAAIEFLMLAGYALWVEHRQAWIRK